MVTAYKTSSSKNLEDYKNLILNQASMPFYICCHGILLPLLQLNNALNVS